jgi:subtilisin family serine protease
MKNIVLPVAIIVTFGLLLAAVLWPMPAADTAQTPPSSDFPFPKQKALFEKLHATDAWTMTKGSPRVMIGVIENGFDFFHPAIKDQLIPGYYAPGGYHLDIYHNVAHGTMVSSIIVARGTPGSEMTGLAPDCKILAACLGLVEQPLLKLKNQFDEEHPNAGLAEFQKVMVEHAADLKAAVEKWTVHMASSAADAVRYLADQGVKLVNISALFRKALIPSEEAWKKLDEAFRYAAGKGVLIVLGAGNNAQECDDYPGEAEAVIVVGAITRDDKRWEQDLTVGGQKIKQGSNYGKRLTVMAPSEGLMGCVPHEERFYACDDGPTGSFKETFKSPYEWIPQGATSCATPIVTSLAALVFSLRPELPAKAVLDVIKRGCDDIGEPGYDIQTGYGKVNFLKTLNLAKEWKE